MPLERELILRAAVPEPVRSELLAVALAVGARYFSRDLLYELFRKQLERVKGSGIVEEWVNEAAEKARAAEAREVLLMVLRQKFGTLASRMVSKVQAAEHQGCHRMLKSCRRW